MTRLATSSGVLRVKDPCSGAEDRDAAAELLDADADFVRS
jgi:hypothetical protein